MFTPGVRKKCITLVSHLFWIANHFTDNDGTVSTRNTSPPQIDLRQQSQQSKMTTSRPFADAHGFSGYDPNLANNQHLVTWKEHLHFWGASWVWTNRIKCSVEKRTTLSRGSKRSQFYWNLVAEQHVYWREQGRNALNYHQAGFERAAPEYEQSARDEVHVAVVRATDMTRAEMLARMDGLEQRAGQSSHQVIPLDELNSVACDALETLRRNLLSEAISEQQRHQQQHREHLQEYQ